MNKTFLDTYFIGWRKYFDFGGLSTRKEYWTFMVVNFIILAVLILAFINSILPLFDTIRSIDWQGFEEMPSDSPGGFFYYFENGSFPINLSEILLPVLLIMLLLVLKAVLIIPTISATIRRLRDANFHWAFFLLFFVPFIGVIVLFIMLVQKSRYYRY